MNNYKPLCVPSFIHSLFKKYNNSNFKIMLRVCKPTRKAYNTKSNKFKIIKVAGIGGIIKGSKNKIKKIKKKERNFSKKKCYISQKMNKYTSKNKKTINRPFGGKIHHSILKNIIILKYFKLKSKKKNIISNKLF
uniref:Ribosomal protein L34 n=1 Tax=Lotharella vacuolata TaxID=74820 RepID=A0A0H5BL53_9EUKA|nr:ribosomal protein L34 [Lotharella vacuolata]